MRCARVSRHERGWVPQCVLQPICLTDTYQKTLLGSSETASNNTGNRLALNVVRLTGSPVQGLASVASERLSAAWA